MNRAIHLTGRLFLFFGIVLLTALSLDELLLRTEPQSLFVLAALALAFAAIVAILASVSILGILHLAGRTDRADRLAVAAPLAASVGGAVVIFANPILRRFGFDAWLPWVWVGSGLVYYLVAGRRARPSPWLDRAGMALLAICLVGAPTIVMFGAGRGPSHGEATPPAGKSGMLLVVVDALGAEFLSGLNPESPVRTPNLDAWLESSTTFPNAHATVPNTHGAFRALYTGQMLEDRTVPRANLVRELQEAGVNVRIVASHMNALPDNKGLSYHGLRSLLLTQNWSWIPRLANLDYHLMTWLDLAREATGKGMKADRLEALRRLSNAGFAKADPLGVGRDELGQLARGDRPFLLMLHSFFNDTLETQPKPQTVDLHQNRTDVERLATSRAIRDRSYRYTDEEAWWAEEYRAAYIDGVRDFDRAFGAFVDSLRSSGILDDIDVILMADHGSSSSDNRLWYGYHPIEATMRIPLAVHTSGSEPGRDLRPAATVDVAATIRDWFGLDETGDGHSLLAAPPAAPALCLTRRDHEDRARLVRYTRTRKDVVEFDSGLQITGLESWAIGEDGRVTGDRLPPPDPAAAKAELETLCARYGCF